MNGQKNEQAKTIPCNIEAERAVLGSMLIDPTAYTKIASFITPRDFYRERHGWLYSVIGYLAERNEPLDTVTICDELERRSQLTEIGGAAYIIDLVNATPTALYVEHYARIIERTATQRRLIAAAGKIAEIAYDGDEEIETSLDKAENLIFGVAQGRAKQSVRPLGEILAARINEISELSANPDKHIGVPTGFNMLDRMLGGLQKSDLIIGAGRPGMGKSAWALSVALNAAKRVDARVAIFSLEMNAEQLSERLLSMETAIDAHRIHIGAIEDEEWTIIMEGANSLSGKKFFIDDTPGASVSDVRATSRRLMAEHGLDMIIIDYMQLMTGPDSGRGGNNGDRQQEISYISRSLKTLARELNVPIIALSQLSRAVEGRADKRPMLSDLRESGSLEQDADVVLFIYRDDYYNPEDSTKQNIADIIVAKHRHGSTGTVSLYFRKELTQFRDLEIERTQLNY